MGFDVAILEKSFPGKYVNHVMLTFDIDQTFSWSKSILCFEKHC